MTTLEAFINIFIMCVITFFLRSAPFLFFSRPGEIPKSVIYLGKSLPPAVIAMLIIYALKDVSFAVFPSLLPELIAMALTALLHVWKRNNLLSIACGTICYMVLVQVVFA